MILIIDNYDSFTYNLVQYVGALTDVAVVKNDDDSLENMAEKADALIFSPGPGWPADAGKMETLIQQFAGKKPILGICLGFQAIVEVFGGKLRLARSPAVRHQSVFCPGTALPLRRSPRWLSPWPYAYRT